MFFVETLYINSISETRFQVGVDVVESPSCKCSTSVENLASFKYEIEFCSLKVEYCYFISFISLF